METNPVVVFTLDNPKALRDLAFVSKVLHEAMEDLPPWNEHSYKFKKAIRRLNRAVKSLRIEPKPEQ